MNKAYRLGEQNVHNLRLREINISIDYLWHALRLPSVGYANDLFRDRSIE